MPLSLQVTLSLTRPAPDAVHVPLHALTYRLISQADPQLGRRLHDTQVPFLSQHTARWQGFGGVLGADRRTLQFRVGVLDDALQSVLEDALAPGLPVGSHEEDQLQGRIVGLVTEASSFEDLLSGGRAPLPVTLDFCTPTVVRSGGRFHALTDPALLYHGLMRRWNAAAATPWSRETWAHLGDDLRVVAQETRPVTLAVPGSRRKETMRAFMGRASLTVAHPRSQEALGALSRLATLCSVGAKTMYGFGAVRLHAGEMGGAP